MSLIGKLYEWIIGMNHISILHHWLLNDIHSVAVIGVGDMTGDLPRNRSLFLQPIAPRLDHLCPASLPSEKVGALMVAPHHCHGFRQGPAGCQGTSATGTSRKFLSFSKRMQDQGVRLFLWQVEVWGGEARAAAANLWLRGAASSLGWELMMMVEPPNQPSLELTCHYQREFPEACKLEQAKNFHLSFH